MLKVSRILKSAIETRDELVQALGSYQGSGECKFNLVHTLFRSLYMWGSGVIVKGSNVALVRSHDTTQTYASVAERYTRWFEVPVPERG